MNFSYQKKTRTFSIFPGKKSFIAKVRETEEGEGAYTEFDSTGEKRPCSLNSIKLKTLTPMESNLAKLYNNINNNKNQSVYQKQPKKKLKFDERLRTI